MMKSVRKGLLVAMVTAAVTVCFVPSMAGAEGIDIGGKTAMSGNFSVTSIHPDEFFGVDIEATIVYVGMSLTRTSASARWEYGAGLTVGIFNLDISGAGDASGSATVASYTPSLQVRINTDLLGSEENFLVYAGLVAGVTYIDFDLDQNDTDTLGAFGPKFGAEYYFASNFAVQLENVLLLDTLAGLTNSLSFGVKVLF